jgi:hypothetical protein
MRLAGRISPTRRIICIVCDDLLTAILNNGGES